MNFSPDRKAPRNKLSSTSCLNRKFYTEFKKKYPQYKDKTNLELGVILKEFNHALREVIVKERDGAELPEGLGYMFLGACKSHKRKNVDYKTSQELGVLVTYRNFDTDGYLAKILYTNFANKYKFLHREIWRFQACRNFKKQASYHFKLDWEKYIKPEKFKNISSFLISSARKAYIKNYNPDTSNYNEFEI